MIRNCFLILTFFVIVFASCNKDEIDELNQKVDHLEDSLSVVTGDYLKIMDSVLVLQERVNDIDTMDIKAFKMLQVGSLFESVARQPEEAETLINMTELLYYDFEELLPVSDKSIAQRGKSRGTSLGKMFEAMARQPEAAPVMDSIAEKFLGKHDPEIISEELLEYSRTYALSYIVEAMARQPMMDSVFNEMTLKYFNFEFSYNK